MPFSVSSANVCACTSFCYDNKSIFRFRWNSWNCAHDPRFLNRKLWYQRLNLHIYKVRVSIDSQTTVWHLSLIGFESVCNSTVFDCIVMNMHIYHTSPCFIITHVFASFEVNFKKKAKLFQSKNKTSFDLWSWSCCLFLIFYMDWSKAANIAMPTCVFFSFFLNSFIALLRLDIFCNST